MLLKLRLLVISTSLAAFTLSGVAAEKRSADDGSSAKSAHRGIQVLWKDPTDISSRNMINGSGGEAHKPQGPFTFVKEDLDGSNPKFDIKDAAGHKWKVKMGAEVKPEVAATRFVWATGYFTYDEYFMDRIKVENLPSHLHRGQKFVEPDGFIREVRLKRDFPGTEKSGNWRWKDEPFAGTPELNGLRTLMALMNSWDLKTVNNAIITNKETGEQMYLVSDLGATFGTVGLTVPLSKARGNLSAYEHSKFIRKIESDEVDFASPGRTSLLLFFDVKQYVKRMHMRSLGRDIPRGDARRMGMLLARLSPGQIRDAFRAAGYSPEAVEGFSKIVEARIKALQTL